MPGLKTRRGLTQKTKKAVRVMPQDNDTEPCFIARIKKTGDGVGF